MKSLLFTLAGILAIAASARAQSPAEVVEQAVGMSLNKVPGQATIIKWKPVYTYDVVRQGTNKLACYDRSDEREPSHTSPPGLVGLRCLIGLDTASVHSGGRAASEPFGCRPSSIYRTAVDQALNTNDARPYAGLTPRVGDTLTRKGSR